ncbi:MAG: zinc ribbon domain-containing protein [Promethearchaeota archaeon]
MNESKILNAFRDFGFKMQIIGILAILAFILPFMGIIQLIYIFLALGTIKKIIYEMPDANLSEFRLKYIAGFLLKLIGACLFSIASLILVLGLMFHRFYAFFSGFIVLLVISTIIFLISAVLEYQAWGCLEAFFVNHRSMFPAMIVEDTLKGIKNLKLGVIFYITLVLSIIGVILQIIGFFRVGSLKNLPTPRKEAIPTVPTSKTPFPSPEQPIPRTTPQPAPQSSSKIITTEEVRYCPHCGSKITKAEKYCPECGAQLN